MTYAETSSIESFGLSHVGVVRADNQDSIRTSHHDDERTGPHGHLFAVADGMGGYQHGGVASTTALQTLFESYYGGKPGQVAQNLRAGVRDANLSVYQASQRLGARMGTTLTGVSILNGTLSVAHIGDSRAYLIQKGRATVLTYDHTAVGDMVRARVLTPDKVRTHSQRSVLNRCLGMQLFVQPDVVQLRLQAGDLIVLCSDGVWSAIEDAEFGQLAEQTGNVEKLTQSLIDLAMERESDDNVSAISIRVNTLNEGLTDASGKRKRRIFPFGGRT